MVRCYLIAHRVTKLQPALLALEDSSMVESPVGGLGSDPLEDEDRQARRRRMAITLCQNGQNVASWDIANRLAVCWGFSCAALGVPRPVDPEGERRPGLARQGA